MVYVLTACKAVRRGSSNVQLFPYSVYLIAQCRTYSVGPNQTTDRIFLREILVPKTLVYGSGDS